jgi:cyclohexa-1,5-dienecarbonyl-CoA hydratase
VTQPSVEAAFNDARTRAAFKFSHPTGNIITADTVAALADGLAAVAADPHLKLITLEGAGQDFSFGASIPEHAPDRIGNVLPAMHRLIDGWLSAPAVTAAVVRGRCLGGGFELALACDLIFAADDAVFGLPEIALGVFPPAGAALLSLRVGGATAARTILTGESRSAAEWQRAGLIELVAPAATLDAEVDRWFSTHLDGRSAVALRYAVAAARWSTVTHVRRVLPELERLYLGDLMRTRDAAEGVAAFLEKRQPRWRDE